MTNRTVQIQGYGYGSTPAEITVTLDGNTVFTGTVSTLNEPVPTNFVDVTMTNLCTFEIPVNFSGNIPMTCTVNNGEVVFAEILANYSTIANPVFSSAELEILQSPTSTGAERIAIYSAHATPSFSSAEIAVLESPTSTNEEKEAILSAHGVTISVSSGSGTYIDINGTPDVRTNVTLDGVAKNTDRLVNESGTWWWTVNSGSTLAYDLNVSAGIE